MSTSVRTLIGTLLLPLLAFSGVLLLVAAHAVGAALLMTVLRVIAGVALYLAATIVAVSFAGDMATR